MIDCGSQCDYCHSSIASGQRWVRERTYDPAHDGHDPRPICCSRADQGEQIATERWTLALNLF